MVKIDKSGRFVAYENRICSVDGCDNEINSNGFCKYHYTQKYHQDHKEEIGIRHKQRRVELKLNAMSYYSNGKPKCVICGFTDPRALLIDHINDNGARHRETIAVDAKKRQGAGATTYLWLEKNNYPDGFQVLCANCNAIKEHARHKRMSKYA